MGALVPSVDWSRLKDAHGYAGDLPALLDRLGHQTGSGFEETLGELCSRIWYNGSIFQATSAAAGRLAAMLDQAAKTQKAHLYEVLAAITDSAREAALSTTERPCAAGAPADGLAVLRVIFSNQRRFLGDLTDRNPLVRRLAARLLVACDDADSAPQVLEWFRAASDPRVRSELLAGLLRLADGIPDWPGFIRAALVSETDPESRFLLRCAELTALRNGVSQEALFDLVSMFVEANQTNERRFTDTCGDPDQFVQTIGMLSVERQVDALCMAIQATTDESLSMILAERLLRIVFHDQRVNWGEASYRMVNRDGSNVRYDPAVLIIFKSLVRLLVWPWMPFLRKRWPRDALLAYVPYIEYGGLEGAPPAFADKLDEQQQIAVVTIARHDPLWRVYTNLWELFALPSNRRDMEEYGVAGE